MNNLQEAVARAAIHSSTTGPFANGLTHQDITAPLVGVEVETNGSVLWVNVDGVCVLRICRISLLTLIAEGKTLKTFDRQSKKETLR